MKQCREHNCPLQDICRGAVDNGTWWNISDDCEIFAFVKSQDNKIFELENRLKECENGYEGTLYLERAKLHDAEEKVKELTEENERLRGCVMSEEEVRDIANEVIKQCTLIIKADTVRKMKERVKEKAKSIYLLSDPPKIMLEIREDMLDQIAEEIIGETNDHS